MPAHVISHVHALTTDAQVCVHSTVKILLNSTIILTKLYFWIQKIEGKTSLVQEIFHPNNFGSMKISCDLVKTI